MPPKCRPGDCCPRRNQRDWLAGQPDFVVVGETGNADVADALARRHRPQVVLVGIRVRGAAKGIAMTRRLRALKLGLEVVFLTLFDGPE